MSLFLKICYFIISLSLLLFALFLPLSLYKINIYKLVALDLIVIFIADSKYISSYNKIIRYFTLFFIGLSLDVFHSTYFGVNSAVLISVILMLDIFNSSKFYLHYYIKFLLFISVSVIIRDFLYGSTEYSILNDIMGLLIYIFNSFVFFVLLNFIFVYLQDILKLYRN
ncbi:hypothetical protein [Rickettsia endosymbiont of Cardiosporidium cionae]|uniref:hypothetical protein n=1 Tax=Rickettsia endosymbiont of Cardiosporidium cionae TaxID=2777155 RepID=UPI00189485F5|nr:hypothetical protein [Rickettsia endosymbiont of Cardiosporidium cionae]KAF8818331.1 hypothetical protein IHI24_000791 [Rickettsia endosymbiont of Cardiosporidium cionae]